MVASLAAWSERHRWIWAALGIVALWAMLGALTDRFSLHSLTGVATSAAFLALPALGQMFVVTTGRGNIDLSIASVVTLSAYVTVTVAGSGDGASLGLAVALALGIGLLTGAVNAALVMAAGIPAMIVTLATGYVLATATLLANRGVKGSAASPVLLYLATAKIGGLPVIAILAVAATALAGILLQRTAYGRMLSAVGQNARAAELAGVAVGRTVATAFLISSVLAALTGMILSAYVGGAFLEMGAPYLLQSVGAVVLGGSLIAGGHSTALGTLLGAMLLVLIVTTMQIAGLPPGSQDIVQGLVIIAVLALAGVSGTTRRSRRAVPQTG